MKPAPISLFAQLTRLIPRDTVQECLNRYPNNTSGNALRYSRWDQLIALMFCHLAGCDSLREIEDGLYSAVGKLEHAAAKPLKRTTLAYINEKRDYRVFKDLYFRLLRRYEHVLGKRLEKRFNQPVYSLDSTTISLCLSLFDWAKYRTGKGGIKLHTIISNDTLMPEVIDMTAANRNDDAMAKTTIEQLPPRCYVVMDRGYCDYRLFYWLHKRGTTFVTRLKESSVITPPMRHERGRGENWGDYAIQFDTLKAREDTHEMFFRLVQWYDKTTDRWFDFVTNNFWLTAEQVAELYKERWQVELFFKKLKQNLKIKSFVGTTENAVMNQVWTACICTLLVEVLKHISTYKWSFSRLMKYLCLNLMTHKPLYEWINRPDIAPRHYSRDKVPKNSREIDLFWGLGPDFST